jgi:hypothetical protein
MTCPVCRRETRRCDYGACPAKDHRPYHLEDLPAMRRARAEARRIGKGGFVFMAVWVSTCLIVILWAVVALAHDAPSERLTGSSHLRLPEA